MLDLFNKQAELTVDANNNIEVYGETFAIKEQLKANGWKFNRLAKAWIKELQSDSDAVEAIKFLIKTGKTVSTNNQDFHEWITE